MTARAFLLAVALGLVAGATQGQGTAGVVTASVSGIVFDSLTRVPLKGAVVEMANADSLAAPPRSVVSDSLGRYVIAKVPRGRYIVGFMHPMLDSLGLQSKAVEVFVDGRAALRRDLAIPSALDIRTAICGAAAVADSDAVILGVVRRASDRLAVDSATVSVRWIDIVLQSGGFRRNPVRRTFVTQETGWYAICGAPMGATIALAANRGADSTEVLELEVPLKGFLRQDLFFGAAQIAAADTVRQAADSLSLVLGRRLTGTGRLSGSVVAASGGRPLAGARVGLRNGPQTRANERGEWALTGLPTGTRTLEVRAVAHYPASVPVGVIDDAGPVRVALVTLQSVMDTVRVTATRMTRDALEFAQRKRSSGAGRFITSEDIRARNPNFTGDLLRTIPGVYVDRDQNGDEILTMRGNAQGRCRVSVFMNRMSLRGMTVSDINGYVRPTELMGIEVYPAGASPPQYSEQNGCGSVLIWTK